MISGCTMESSTTGLNGPRVAESTCACFLQQHDDAEHHRRRPHHRRADQHRLGRRLEGVARAVALLELILGVLEVGLEPEVLLISSRIPFLLSIWLSS
jgi:hypothetical protein